jgi:hypothetical protein
MKYIQVGEIGKAVLVSTKSDLPTAGIAYLNKFYVATDKNIVYTCKPEGSGYAWKVATILPALTNGIAVPGQLQEGVEAIDANGNKVTGTMKLVEKTANANGTYVPSEDNAQGYSKFIVDVAGETAENPYVATTEAEMKAYLAEEYVGSFVKYKTSLYFDQANSTPLHCSSLETTGAIDTGLGPEYVNMKIDEWLPEPGMVKIASIETFNHDNTFMGVSQPYSIRETFDLYAWKYKNTDGSYTRVLFYAWAQTWAYVYTPDSSTSWSNNAAGGVVFYQDNMTSEANTALGQLSLSVTAGDYTGTTSVAAAPAEYEKYLNLGFFSYAVPNHNNYTDYYGKYASEDSDAKAGISGVAQLSWATNKSVYWNSITYPRCTYLYKDASVLLWCIQRDIAPNKPESEKTYRDGFVYIVNSKKATRNKWQAESPLVEGDQLAGATLYFNQQITLKEFDDLCNSMIADSETEGGTYFLYNVTNPYTSENMSELISNSCPLVVAHDGGLMSYLNYVEGSEGNIYLFDNNDNNSTIKYASIVAPSSLTADGMTITVPATLGKVNKPDISNAVIGKTANFTSSVEEYSIYYFTQEVVPGNVFIESNTAKMNALLGDETTNNEIAENRVYLFTGQDGKYLQGTFYQLSNGSLHILPPLDVEDTALIPVYFETQEGWFHSPSGTSVKQLIQLISKGTYAVYPASPSVAKGKFFDAWYTQPTGGTEWNFSTAINEPTILYAQYIS